MQAESVKKNIRRYYVISFLSGLMFSIPIMVLFRRDNGLNMFQITFLQSLFAIAVVALEVPTGYVADILGRKKSIIMSLFFYLLGYIVYGFGSSFGGFLAAEILLAFAVSFLSGAEEALVYDSLKQIGEERRYKKIIGNVAALGMLAVAISSIVGSLLVNIGYRSLIWLSAPFLFIAFVLSFWLKEAEKFKVVVEKNYLADIRKGIKFVFQNNPKLKRLIFYFGIISGINSAALWFYQPYFQIVSLNILYFGIIFASFQVFTALVSKVSHNVENLLGRKFSLIAIAVLVVVSYFLMGNIIFAFSFGFAYLQQFARGFNKVLASDYINQEVGSSYRATILSINSLFSRLIYASLIPLLGSIADMKGILYSLNVSGVLAFVAGGLILRVLHKKKVI
ncbi:MAG: MFS transporter [Candidatus Absconditabacterales bacterium]